MGECEIRWTAVMFWGSGVKLWVGGKSDSRKVPKILLWGMFCCMAFRVYMRAR